jgi:hypothetical protein
MAVLHSVLAAYGAFDQVAVQTDDPEILALIEKLVPGTTGDGQRGWYGELQAFVRKQAREQAAQHNMSEAEAETQAALPSLGTAVTEITSQRDAPEFDHRAKQRTLYAAMGLQALKELAEERSVSVPALDAVDDALFATIFAVTAEPVPSAETSPGSSGSPTPTAAHTQMLDVIKGQGLEGWNQLMAEVAKEADPPVPREVAGTPAVRALGESAGPVAEEQKLDANGNAYTEQTQGKASAEVIVVKGVLCSLLTTDFYRTPYDINVVKNNIHPLNWDNANKFFADMKPKGRSPDNRADQVLEEVSTAPEIYRIKTDLKYVREVRPQNTYVINYDFADPRSDGDSHQVLVDSGYIVAGPTEDGKGVRVVTSKMVAIEGLSPTAVAVFAHAMGWLSIGEMMIFGTPVDMPGDPLVDWDYAGPSPSSPGETTQAATSSNDPPKSPQPVSRILVNETTKALADYIETASNDALVVADKWLQGKLSVEDMLGYSQRFGGQLFSQPFKVLNEMMKQVAGSPDGKATGSQQQGGGGSA